MDHEKYAPAAVGGGLWSGAGPAGERRGHQFHLQKNLTAGNLRPPGGGVDLCGHADLLSESHTLSQLPAGISSPTPQAIVCFYGAGVSLTRRNAHE